MPICDVPTYDILTRDVPTQQALYTACYKAFSQAKTLFATAHVGPDGDTLGSMLGLRHALLQHFPQIERFDCVIAGHLPEVYTFLPGMEHIINVETSTMLLPSYDVAISVDCGAESRLGPALPYFQSAPIRMNFDHHVSNESFGTVNVLEFEAASSTQVIANFLNHVGVAISKEAATCLYVGLVTDTGGFRHSSTNPMAFELAAQLQRCGCDVSAVYRTIFESRPRCQSLLHAEAICQSTVYANGLVVGTQVSQALLNQLGAKEEHVEGLIDILRQTQGCELTAVVREIKSGGSKISLRSNSDAFNVSDFLATHYGGGGHKRAAGATVNAPLQATYADLIAKLTAWVQG